MGVTVKGVKPTMARMTRVTDVSRREVLRVLLKGAQDIQSLARRMAPVDEGNLEQAIVLDPPNLTEETIAAGTRRKNITVYVDENLPAENGKKVGDYATVMHESVYEPGEKSQAKQSADPSVTVGRKYLERAVDEIEPEIYRSVEDKLREVIRRET